jgi:hypothetical protein
MTWAWFACVFARCCPHSSCHINSHSHSKPLKFKKDTPTATSQPKHVLIYYAADYYIIYFASFVPDTRLCPCKGHDPAPRPSKDTYDIVHANSKSSALHEGWTRCWHSGNLRFIKGKGICTPNKLVNFLTALIAKTVHLITGTVVPWMIQLLLCAVMSVLHGTA